jgi:hypothetical protein
VTTTTAIAAQAVETGATNAPATGSWPSTWRRACGYPAAPPRTGPPTTASGSVCSTACNATGPAPCGWIRDAAIVRPVGPVTPRGPGCSVGRSVYGTRRPGSGPGLGTPDTSSSGFPKRTGESRRRASYSTTMSLPETDTVPRPRGQTFVSILNVVPSPGIFAKICWGPRTICPFSTS